MKYYAVIDTNVLVSAMIKFDSVPGNILQLLFGGTIVPLFNEDILNEYRTVLRRDKFHLSEEIIGAVVGKIEQIGFHIDKDDIDEELPDPKDRVFYEVVMKANESEDAYLVTGNIKHFPTKPFIVTPRQMLDIIFNDY